MAHRPRAAATAGSHRAQSGVARCSAPPAGSRSGQARRGRLLRRLRRDRDARARYAPGRWLGGRAGQNRSPAGPAAPLPAALDPLVQVGPFVADGGGLAMAREHLGLVGEREQLAADALDDLRKAGIGIGGVPGAARKERVARKEMLTAEQADAARCMPGCVQGDELVLTEAKALPVVDALIGLD